MFFIHGMIKFIFFAQYYNKKLFPILGKKQKQKIFTKPIKKNYKHGCYSVIEMFLKMRKLKKKKCYDNSRDKNMSDPDTEKEKYLKNCYYN